MIFFYVLITSLNAVKRKERKLNCLTRSHNLKLLRVVFFVDASGEPNYAKRCIGLSEFYIQQLLLSSIPFSIALLHTFPQRIKIMLSYGWGKLSYQDYHTLGTHSDYSLWVNETLGFSNSELTQEGRAYSNSETFPSFCFNINQGWSNFP